MNPPSPPLEAAAAPILCTVDVVLLTLNPQLQVALLQRDRERWLARPWPRI